MVLGALKPKTRENNERFVNSVVEKQNGAEKIDPTGVKSTSLLEEEVRFQTNCGMAVYDGDDFIVSGFFFKKWRPLVLLI